MTIKAATDTFTSIAHAVSQPDADYAVRHRHLQVWIPGTAKGTDAKFAFFYLDKAVTIKSAKLIPTAAVTANGTDYVIITLGTNDGAGGAVTGFATVINTASVSWVLGTAIPFAGIDDRDSLAAALYLAIDVSHGGAGVATTGGYFIDIEYELN